MVERITLEEFQTRLKAQNLPREHHAVKCPVCGTVQSMASLRKAGVPEDQVEFVTGFSCEGRWTKAGPWPGNKDPKKLAARQATGVRGCNWTLGGLFKMHKLEVEKDGEVYPMFEVATPEEAAWLRMEVTP